ncbi:alpha-L-rhamnosidase-like protein [Rhodococcus wratislaviensis]|uniref:Bacterial alpha-L-rhamnosidase n=1 Tax=Rhodococcus wratislaviensis TaxID=44752 RepID=A0AB38FCQ0_RHOWR|nr:amylo-alpha-1,6-glucosidase [Rhodococcus wratislaviensis]REE75690.1 alpha-L-rhamnosidase-like protein [Rhodococcus wratislaviensis]SPZ39271.1 Bacterial alpha-L-rhamnosidase [Rhodococcus wratislaviensis]
MPDLNAAPSATGGRAWPVQWQGHWISAPAPAGEEPAQRTAITPDTPRHPFERVLFTHTFDLAEAPKTFPARLTADSRYVLLVNGRTVGRGPVRSQPDRLHFDDHDLAPFVIAGENRVEVIVTYYGRPNSIWAPARQGSGLGDRATLVFEAHDGDHWLVTDGDWSTQILGQWSTLPATESRARVPFECLDETHRPGRVEFAEVRAVNHMGGLARSQPPTMPYGRLLPRPIGTLDGDNITPVSAGATTIASAAVDALAPLYRIQQLTADASAPEFTAYAWGATLSVSADRPALVAVDMGRIVCGYVTVSATSSEQARIGTALTEKAVTFTPDDPNQHVAGSIWVKKPGHSTFRALEKNGFRYAYLLIETDRDAEVSLRDFAVREDLYQLTGDARFSSSDMELNRIYDAGRRTAVLNSHDAFVDCPTREQRAWTGDLYVHALVHLTCSDDWRLVRRSLEVANSPRGDGILPMAAAADLEYIDNVTIPDWSLYWVHGLYSYYRYSGDLEFVRTTLPTVSRIISWYLAYQDPATGLVGYTPEWNLADWSAIFLDGYSSILNGMLGRTLTEFAEMSRAIGNTGDADWAMDRHARIRAGFERFWDPTRRVYRDHIGSEHGLDATSQLANSCAVLSGFAPLERHADIVAALTLDDRSVYRNWIGEPGRYSPERRRLHLLGIQQIDWDTENEIMRAEPFGSALVHDALHELGAHDELLHSIRQWSAFLANGYDTFGECWGFGTPCHGWSSYPTVSLIRYILGVTPASPGFDDATVAPRYDLLPSARGTVPTPHGSITLDWSETFLRIDSPVPFRVVHPDGTDLLLSAGRHELSRADTPCGG